MTAQTEETKTAEWVAVHFYILTGMKIKCSSCGKLIFHTPRANPDFCPKCGAKMGNSRDLLAKDWKKALDNF